MTALTNFCNIYLRVVVRIFQPKFRSWHSFSSSSSSFVLDESAFSAAKRARLSCANSSKILELLGRYNSVPKCWRQQKKNSFGRASNFLISRIESSLQAVAAELSGCAGQFRCFLERRV